MATRLNVGNETFAQLVRFAIVGLFLAAIYSAIYWYLATFVMAPVLAVVIAFAVSVTLGYVRVADVSRTFHGWDDTEWSRSVENAAALARQVWKAFANRTQP